MYKLVAELICNDVNWIEVRTWTTMTMKWENEEKFNKNCNKSICEKFLNSFKKELLSIWFNEDEIKRIDVYLTDNKED